MTDLAALNDADLDALRLAVLLEQERRNLLVQAPATSVWAWGTRRPRLSRAN